MSNERGFTLLEVLVAAALFGLVMLMAGEGMRAALSGWRVTQDRTGSDGEISDAQAVVRRLLTEAWPSVVRDRDGVVRLAFHGEERVMRLIAAVPPGSGMLSAIELRLAGNSLVVRTAPIDPRSRTPFDALADAPATVLVEGFKQASFAYWDGTADWRSRWRELRSLPVLVRLRLSFRDDDARTWPELLAAPQAETPVVF
jgi:general secretion pathway protein J